VAGSVAPGFEEVREAFAALDLAGPSGGAFAVCREGRMLVDLWGGGAGRAGRAWERDTASMILSGTKGLVAACLLALVEDGRLAPQRPVADYWPEFAAHGKGDVTVAELASHRAGLPFVEQELAIYDLLDARRMADRLAAQRPLWPAPRPFAYHALTYGWLCGELVRRVTGASVGRLLHERFCGPLGLELWLGLPPAEQHRVAELFLAPGRSEGVARHQRAARTYENPPVFAEPLLWNLPRLREAEIASSGAIGTARAVAAFYAALVTSSGAPSLRRETVALGRTQLVHDEDAMYGDELALGFGWELQTAERRLGPDPAAFGHTGAGGSVHGAWPDAALGFSFHVDELRDEHDDPRARLLLEALWEALRR
jgi:CubicO group peptidase (beta-lactamase class C family)